jgi:hypothetical protein
VDVKEQKFLQTLAEPLGRAIDAGHATGPEEPQQFVGARHAAHDKALRSSSRASATSIVEDLTG